jgi:hypothetical protein
MPYCHPIFLELILHQWFRGGNSEGVKISSNRFFKNIPLPIFALVATVVRPPIVSPVECQMRAPHSDQVESALMEWREGDFQKVDFSTEAVGLRCSAFSSLYHLTSSIGGADRYDAHLMALQKLEEIAPNWTRKMRENLYKKIV